MAKKKAAPGAPGATLTVGLDLGYGIAKAIALGIEPVMFPSVWGMAREIKFNVEKLTEDYPGDQITDEDGSWFVGNLALSQLTAGEVNRLRGRTANEATLGNVARVRLAKVALGKVLSNRRGGDAVHVSIATGLPVDHMRDAASLKASLIGKHRIQTDTSDFVANIVEVMVMPQPYGTIYANTLTNQGQVNPCHTATRTGVVDVGTYTVDLALDDDGEYIDAESGSVESGIYLAQQRISQAIERDHRQTPKYSTIESVLRTGCLKAKGKTYDYAAEVQAALEPIRNSTLSKMNELWGGGLNADVIYLSGGGAELVETAIKGAYEQAVLVEGAQLANARGYLNYAAWRARE